MRIPAKLFGCLSLALLLMGSLVSSLSAAEEPTLRLLAFGDSLTHGYGLALEDTFPVRLESFFDDESRHLSEQTVSLIAHLDIGQFIECHCSV